MRVPHFSFARIAKRLFLTGALAMLPILNLSAAAPGTGVALPADPPLLLVDGTILRPFVVAKDEIYVLDRVIGKSRFDIIAEQPDFTRLSELIESSDGAVQDVRMVVYRQGEERSIGNRRVISKAVMVKMAPEHRTMEDVAVVAQATGLAIGWEELTTNGWMALRTSSSRETLEKSGVVGAHPFVERAQPSLGSTLKALACDTGFRELELNDPLFPNQWYYQPNDNQPEVNVNIKPTWTNRLPGTPIRPLSRPYTGKNIRIGIADQSLEIQHEDLKRNVVKALSRDFVSGDTDPSPGNTGESHGTWVGGVAGARGGNGIGIIGAAPECDLVGFRIDFNANFDDIQPQVFDEASGSVPILNNSYGSSLPYLPETEATQDTLEKNVLRRDRMIVFSAGNSGEQADDTNYAILQTSKYTIAVGAISRLGGPAPYSTPGASVNISGASGIEDTPPLSLTTTDIGSPYNRYVDTAVNGTSFSAPMVSGVIGLMLQARPDLGWRDVQYILALTGNRMFGAAPAGPTVIPHSYPNGWNMVDATAAVSFAETWSLLPDGGFYETVRSTRTVGSVDGRFINPRGNAAGGWKTFDFNLNGSAHSNLWVEHATLRVEWEEGSVDLPQDVILISPAGYYDDGNIGATATSVLSRAPTAANDFAYPAPEDWTYQTVRHWDERAGRGYMRGVWRVMMRVRHFGTTLPDERRLRKLTLEVFGNDVNFSPALLSADLTSSANPGVINPQTALDDEDLIVSNIVLRDIDYDVNSLGYQWEVRGEDQDDWLSVPGQGGLIKDICTYQGPKAEFDVDEWPGIVGNAVRFRDFSKGGCSAITQWIWDFDDDGVTDSTEKDPVFTFATPGNYRVTLIVIDENGNAEGIRKTFAVIANKNDFDGSQPPFRFRDETLLGISQIDGINAYNGPDLVLPAAVTVSGSSYRLRLEPRDEMHDGTRFFTEPVFIAAVPPGLACHGEPFTFRAKLPINRTPPDEVPPYVLVNEFSQGTLPHPANGEWVEFFTTVEVDLRDYKISNNHATFDVEFAHIDFWKAIPAGTLIVVYNGDFRDAVLPPDDLDASDRTLVINSNSSLCVLPSNGDGWGEFANFFPAFVDILDPQCIPIHGVSWNRNTTFPAQITPATHGLPAENISQMEGAHVESAVDLENDFSVSGNWQYNSAFTTSPDPMIPSATPAMANSTVNMMTIDSTLTLNGGTFYSSVPRYAYSPLVPGLTMDEETGVLSGIPNLPDGGTFDITVTRSLSWDSSSQTFTLTVKAAPDGEDSDSDSAVNLIERAMGMDISVADAEKLPQVSLIAQGGFNFLGITFRQFGLGVGGFLDTDPASPSYGSYIYSDGNSELRYAVWSSTDLVTWTNESANDGLVQVSIDPATDNPNFDVVTYRLASDITVTGAARYLQVRVTRVPLP
jgi:PKD repeat protein/subtilisin family serine protease